MIVVRVGERIGVHCRPAKSVSKAEVWLRQEDEVERSLHVSASRECWIAGKWIWMKLLEFEGGLLDAAVFVLNVSVG